MQHGAADRGGLTSLLAADLPGRSLSAAARQNCANVEWYPTVAGLAVSGDLGFTAGPWVCTLAGGGGQAHGQFLTVWKRAAGAGWQVQLDGGISHPAPADSEPRLVADPAWATPAAPGPTLGADDPVSQTIADFQGTAREDGLAAALRTYARTRDFRFYTDDQAPMGLASAERHFTAHPLRGAFREDSRVRSLDSTLAYCAGRLTDLQQQSSHAYTQIWQYESRVANWGLRVLLINSPPSLSN